MSCLQQFNMASLNAPVHTELITSSLSNLLVRANQPEEQPCSNPATSSRSSSATRPSATHHTSAYDPCGNKQYRSLWPPRESAALFLTAWHTSIGHIIYYLTQFCILSICAKFTIPPFNFTETRLQVHCYYRKCASTPALVIHWLCRVQKGSHRRVCSVPVQCMPLQRHKHLVGFYCLISVPIYAVLYPFRQRLLFIMVFLPHQMSYIQLQALVQGCWWHGWTQFLLLRWRSTHDHPSECRHTQKAREKESWFSTRHECPHLKEVHICCEVNRQFILWDGSENIPGQVHRHWFWFPSCYTETSFAPSARQADFAAHAACTPRRFTNT